MAWCDLSDAGLTHLAQLPRLHHLGLGFCDRITIDARARQITLQLSEQEIAQRMKSWKPPKPRYRTGVLAKYAQLVSSASDGAITDA